MSAQLQPNAVAPPESAPSPFLKPTISRRRRVSLTNLHESAAANLTRAMRAYLAPGDNFIFSGLGFETFESLAAADVAEASSAIFELDSSRIAGLVLASRELAVYLIESRLGYAIDAVKDASESALTNLESAVLRGAIDEMIAAITAAYEAANIARPSIIRRGERLGDIVMFARSAPMIVFRFRAGAADNRRSMMVAANVEFIGAVADPGPSIRPAAASRAADSSAVQLPFVADVVLGSWRSAVGEVASIKVGDEIVIPPGDEAWLSSGDIHLLDLAVEFGPDRTILRAVTGSKAIGRAD